MTSYVPSSIGSFRVSSGSMIVREDDTLLYCIIEISEDKFDATTNTSLK